MVRYIADSDDKFSTLTGTETVPTGYLTLLVDGRISNSFTLHGNVKLGRGNGNTVVVSDRKVSRHHVTMSYVDSSYLIQDEGSINGTYVNGVQIRQPVSLKNDDIISLGDTIFVFTINKPDPDSIKQSLPNSIVHSTPSAIPPVATDVNTVLLETTSNIPIKYLIGCVGLFIIALLFLLAILVTSSL